MAGEELRKANCEAELLKNKGRALIFVYPDPTLRDGRVWAFKPYAKGELCSGRTASYYGTLSNPLTGDLAVRTISWRPATTRSGWVRTRTMTA